MLERDIFFNKEEHKYTDIYNNPYKSVTTVLKDFKEPFNTKYWSMIKANQRGVSRQVILDEWKQKCKEGCDKGSEVHGHIESNIDISTEINKSALTSNIMNRVVTIDDIIRNKPNGTPNDKLQKLSDRFKDIYNALRYFASQGFQIYSEIVAYDYDSLICGTIDSPLINFDTNELIILDWKTYKVPIMFESGYFKKDANGEITNVWIKTDSYFKSPINHIQYSNGNEATLQLSIYGYLCELRGLKLKNIAICHIRGNDNDGLLVPNVQFYRRPYWKKEVIAIFDSRKKELAKRNNQNSLFSPAEMEAIKVKPTTDNNTGRIGII